MTYELTNQEKMTIIEQHMKTLAYAEYNNVISLIEIEATTNPDKASIDNIKDQISKTTAQKKALQKEFDSLKNKTKDVE